MRSLRHPNMFYIIFQRWRESYYRAKSFIPTIFVFLRNYLWYCMLSLPHFVINISINSSINPKQPSTFMLKVPPPCVVFVSSNILINSVLCQPFIIKVLLKWDLKWLCRELLNKRWNSKVTSMQNLNIKRCFGIIIDMIVLFIANWARNDIAVDNYI